MTPDQIKAIATLIKMASDASVSIYTLLSEAEIPDDQWDEIVNKVNYANSRWENAPSNSA